jgi:hypothetical protein
VIPLDPEVALGTDVTYDLLAHLTGVSRQTLYRWREIAGGLPPTDMAAGRTKGGHVLHR